MGSSFYDFVLLLSAAIISLTAAVINRSGRLSPRKTYNRYNYIANEINIAISNALSSTSATRIMVLRTHNGRGRPTAFKNYKVSAIYGSNIRIDTQHLYKDIQVDSQYTEMLNEIIKFGKVEYNTSSMGEGMLRDIYTLEGQKISTIYKLLYLYDGLIYISYTSEKHDHFSSADQIHFGLLNNKIKDLLNEEAPLWYRILKKVSFQEYFDKRETRLNNLKKNRNEK